MEARVRHFAVAAAVLSIAWIALYWLGMDDATGNGTSDLGGGTRPYQPKVTVVDDGPERKVALPAAVRTEPRPIAVSSDTTASSEPARNATQQPDSATRSSTSYTVQPGDTLSGIAKRLYGRSALWRVIRDANSDLTGVDGRAIRPGMVLTIPQLP